MAEEDVIMTFDPKPFLKGWNRISKEVYDFTGNATNNLKKFISKIPVIGKKAKSTGEDVQKSGKDTEKKVGGSFKNLILKAGLLVASIGLIKKALDGIPEIGLTFKAVGRIVQKNLLWPLRKELIPVLQKFLDWARNSRGLFVKWGSVIVNIFKAAKTIIGGVFNLIKTLTKSIMDSMGLLTKFAGRDITNIINIIVFKLTALFALLEVKLKPIFEFIGKNIGEMAKGFGDFFKELKDIDLLDKFFTIMNGLGKLMGVTLIESFKRFKIILKPVLALIKGFLKGLSGVEDTNKKWEDFVDNLSKTFELVTELVSLVSKKLTPVFNTLGSVIGKIVKSVLSLLVTALNGIAKAISAILQLNLDAIKMFSGDDEKGKTGPKSGLGSGNITKVDDAIINKDGKIIKTNPKDTIVALKNPQESMKSSTNPSSKNVSFGDFNININVTEGSARNAGEDFANGLLDKMRQAVIADFERGGNR